MESWSDVLDYWSIGVMESWSIGLLELIFQHAITLYSNISLLYQFYIIRNPCFIMEWRRWAIVADVYKEALIG